MMKKTDLKIFLPLIIAFCLVLGILLGQSFQNSKGESTLFFPVTPKFSNLTKLNEIFNFIEDAYVDSVDKNELMETAITETLAKLDPHSYYIPAKKFETFNQPLEGNFDGIGVEFRIVKDTVVVINVIEGGPSEKAGLLDGDRIVFVDTIPISGAKITNEKVMKLLKGPRGTKVKVKIKRRGEKSLISKTITRGVIPIKSIEVAYLIDKDIAYLKISRFSKTTYTEFVEAVSKLKKEGMEKIIIDLRGNGGGLLNTATAVLDELLPKNKLIVYTKGRARRKQSYYSTPGGILTEAPVVVLINESSASASEIVAGAIQDNDRGIIIGRRSFGKGLVQEQIQWPDGSAIRLTVARYYTPSGRCIQKPYEGKSLEDYEMEAYNRYESGELFYEDSVHVEDTIKYFTLNGRVVYGGGGIKPDIFIPIDTSDQTEYYNKLRYFGVFQTYCFNYVDTHRDKLKSYSTIEDFKERFLISNTLLNDFINYAEQQGFKYNDAQFKKSKKIIVNRLKASIARYYYGDIGFYEIMNNSDDAIKRAISELKHPTIEI